MEYKLCKSFFIVYAHESEQERIFYSRKKKIRWSLSVDRASKRSSVVRENFPIDDYTDHPSFVNISF